MASTQSWAHLPKTIQTTSDRWTWVMNQYTTKKMPMMPVCGKATQSRAGIIINIWIGKQRNKIMQSYRGDRGSLGWAQTRPLGDTPNSSWCGGPVPCPPLPPLGIKRGQECCEQISCDEVLSNCRVCQPCCKFAPLFPWIMPNARSPVVLGKQIGCLTGLEEAMPGAKVKGGVAQNE